MAKTYRPGSKPCREAKAYRRKTLDHGAGLNIPRDDDDLENIDEYWKTAESVLKDDSTAEIEETSIYKSDTEPRKGGEEADEQSDTLFDIRAIRESLSAKAVAGGALQCAGSPRTSSILENKAPPSSFREARSETCCSAESKGAEQTARLGFDSDAGMQADREVSPAKEMGDRYRNRVRSLGAGHARPVQRAMAESREIYEYKGETLRNSEGKEVAVTNVSGLYKGRSAFEPLMACGGLETAVLFLNSLAFIKPERAICSFSMFMVKGTVCMEMGQDKIILKRGSVCIVEQGTVYSISNSFGTRCTILLTYSAT